MSEQNWQKLKHDQAFRQRMATRQRIIAEVRRWFLARDFTEAETPILVAQPGMEPNLDIFETTVSEANGPTRPAYLITSPEYSLKKLLAAGYERIFEITKCFRDREPFGGQHNPEFTMIEWYRSGADYTDLMKDTEELVAAVATAVHGDPRISWQGQAVDLTPPWPRLSLSQAFERYCGGLALDRAINDQDWFRSAAAERGVAAGPEADFEELFFKLFLRDIEPKLGQPEKEGEPARPVFLYDYPASMAALSRLKPSDERFAERFEAYCGGLELANAFSELNDTAEQRQRLVAEQTERRRLDKPVPPIDERFLEAVGQMPASAGIAFGLDRLVMLLTDTPNIRDVLFFPASDLFSASDGPANDQ